MLRRALRITILFFIYLLPITGCDTHEVATVIPSVPIEMLKKPLLDPIEPTLYELPSQALATWREHAKFKPTMILFSSHPLLNPIPIERKQTSSRLLRDGSIAQVELGGRSLSSEPFILPTETISVAIENRYFKEIVIVLPSYNSPEEVDLDAFRKKAISAGFITETEADEFSLHEGTIKGILRGIPLRIAHPERLPAVSTPTILHIDLSFFKNMYINEIKTPVYELLKQTTTRIKEAGYQTIATTLSFSNQEIGIPLESRFLIRDLAAILKTPSFLEENTPASWVLRAQALYANAMYSENNARELIKKAAEMTPDDAAAHYALAINLLAQKNSDAGFASLDRAVSLDQGYALQYLTLMERAVGLGRSDMAIQFLEKASIAIPENPFIRLELARHLIQGKYGKEALMLIDGLLSLKWSKEFYAEVPLQLLKMKEAALATTIP